MEIIVYEPSEYHETSALRIKSEIEGNHQIIGLSGGNTPKPVYSYLDELMDYTLEIIQVDERFVPVSSKRSNQKMICETMPKIISNSRFHPVNITDGISLQESTENYNSIVQKILGDNNIDLLILGMGLDGHTASLFPESLIYQSSINSRCKVLSIDDSNQPEPRITLSPTVINNCKRAIFLITGKAKGSILAAGIQSGDIMQYPFLLALNQALVIVDSPCWEQYLEVIQ